MPSRAVGKPYISRVHHDYRLPVASGGGEQYPIREGSHGIHGLDLLGRKVNLAGGITLAIFEEEMQPALEAAAASESLEAMGQSGGWPSKRSRP